MVIAVMKIYYNEEKARIIQYRSNKNFREESFKTGQNNMNFWELIQIISNFLTSVGFFLSIFNNHAPKIQKFVRANDFNFVNYGMP